MEAYENIIGTLIPFESLHPIVTHDPSSSLSKTTLDQLRAVDHSVECVREAGNWLPDSKLPASLWELFGSDDEAGADGLALAFAQRLGPGDAGRPWLWVQDGESRRRSGRPYLHGLPIALRHDLLHVAVRTPADALWAMEEGVRCASLSFVIGEIAGDPKCLDFTASRRLVLAAERHGVPLLLVRRHGQADLSAARLRWRINSAQSNPHPWNPRAPGAPLAAAELFRARGFRPGSFLLTHGVGHDPARTGDRLDLAAPLCDRSMEPDRRAAG
jgi:protein ImuA